MIVLRNPRHCKSVRVCKIALQLADVSSTVVAANFADFLTDLFSLADANDAEVLSAGQQPLGAVSLQVYDRLGESL